MVEALLRTLARWWLAVGGLAFSGTVCVWMGYGLAQASLPSPAQHSYRAKQLHVGVIICPSEVCDLIHTS